jgi:DNA polymerase III gamma/tau subunit
MPITDEQKCHGLSRSNNYKPCPNKETFPGSGVCKMHGGMNPNVAHMALRRATLTSVAKVANEVVEGTVVYPDNPFDTLNATLVECRHFKELLERKLNQMANEGEEWRFTDKSGAEQLRSEIALYERALDRMVRAATALSKLNLEERFAKLSEKQAMSMIWIINEVFKRVGLTEAQREEARMLVPMIIEEMFTQTGKKRYI